MFLHLRPREHVGHRSLAGCSVCYAYAHSPVFFPVLQIASKGPFQALRGWNADLGFVEPYLVTQRNSTIGFARSRSQQACFDRDRMHSPLKVALVGFYCRVRCSFVASLRELTFAVWTRHVAFDLLGAGFAWLLSDRAAMLILSTLLCSFRCLLGLTRTRRDWRWSDRASKTAALSCQFHLTLNLARSVFRTLDSWMNFTHTVCCRCADFSLAAAKTSCFLLNSASLQ